MGMRRHDGDPENGRRHKLPSKHQQSESLTMTGRHDLDNIAKGVGTEFSGKEDARNWDKLTTV